MSETRPRVLVVDDEASFASLVAEILSEGGFEVTTHHDPREALHGIDRQEADVAVVDLKMPAMDGLQLTEALLARDPDIQVVILTGASSLASAVEGIHKGVFDYIEKGELDAARLVRATRAAAERARLRRLNRELMERTRESNRLLEALHELSTALAAQPHLDRLLEVLVSAARDLVQAERGRVILFRSMPERTVEVAVGDEADSVRGVRLKSGEGIAALALEIGDAVLLDRPREHPRWSSRCDDLSTARPGLITAPMRHGSVEGALTVAGRMPGFTDEQRRLVLALARQAAVAIDKARDLEAADNFFTHVSELLVSVLDQVDPYYAGHSRAVAVLSDMVSRRLGMSEDERRDVHFGALLHDIGKIRLTPGLLSGGRFTREEQGEEIRRHPRLGLDLLRPITRLSGVLPIVHAHHERWDGRGYPLGLRAEGIPLGARIVAVAEVFDAMTRQTPYSDRMTPEEALSAVEASAGTQFEPRIARLFVKEYRKHAEGLPI